MKTINWHYSREREAEYYLHLFDIGITNSISFFAKHRYGKTAFLCNDIAPLARKKGYDIIYCQIEEDSSNPAKALVTIIEEAITRQSLLGKLSAFLIMRKADLSASSAAGDAIDKLSNQLHKLSMRKRRTLFLFDEITYLSNHFESSLTATLRTALDQHANMLCAIYASASHTNLAQLFHDIKSPLYHSTQQYNLPDMDTDFLRFMCAKYRRVTGGTILIADAEQVLKQIGLSPDHFMRIIDKMISDKHLTIVDACHQYLATDTSQ